MSAPVQQLLFSVAGPLDGEVSSMVLEWTRAGEERRVALTDDGAHPADLPWDGVWTGGDRGPPVREAPVRIVLTDLSGSERVIFEGVVPVGDARSASLAWQVRGSGAEARAGLIEAAWPGETLIIPEAASLYVGAAWTGLCFVIAASLVHALRRDGVGW